MITLLKLICINHKGIRDRFNSLMMCLVKIYLNDNEIVKTFLCTTLIYTTYMTYYILKYKSIINEFTVSSATTRKQR